MRSAVDAQVPHRAVSAQAHALVRLAEIAEQLGEGSTAADIRELTTRISEGRFFVACVGQFKRGKSTLLDAFVGEPVLPTGVVPVTAVPTVLRHGNARSARICIDGRWQGIPPNDLSQYVSEESNHENSKQIAGVEVFFPSPLLASGMTLVDTPGIGSVYSGNSETTREFIPQIDAAILVVGTDPPISGEELALIEAVAVNVDKILIVLNKIDRVSQHERRQALSFTRRILETRLNRPIGRIYEVSALNRLNGCAGRDDWSDLVADLTDLAARSGQAMTLSAAERGLRRFSASLQRSISERIRALKEPIASSEQRLANLRQTVVQAEQSLRDIGALFSAEQIRLSNTLLARRKEFLRGVLPAARQEFVQKTGGLSAASGPMRRRQLMALAQDVARHYILPWLDSEEIRAEELYGVVTQRFVDLVTELLQRISKENSADFCHLPKALDTQPGFRSRSRFCFHDMAAIAQPASPLLYLFDLLMGMLHVHRWFLTDAGNFLRQILETNAARVQGDVEQRVVESRLLLESEVRKLLLDVSISAEQALSRARMLMENGNAAVQQELACLLTLREEITTSTCGF